MDIDNPFRIPRREGRRKDAHEARKHDQIDLFLFQNFQQARFKRLTGIKSLPRNRIGADPGVFRAGERINLRF